MLVFRCSNNNNKVVEEKKKMQMFCVIMYTELLYEDEIHNTKCESMREQSKNKK